MIPRIYEAGMTFVPTTTVEVVILMFYHLMFPVQEVIIDQMNEEEMLNTFYTKKELSIFKIAYRMHRSRPYWTREMDGSTCYCDACEDKVDMGGSRFTLESPPVSPPRSSPQSQTGYHEVYAMCQLELKQDHEVNSDTCEEEVPGAIDGPPSPVISDRGGAREFDEPPTDVYSAVNPVCSTLVQVSSEAKVPDRVAPCIQEAVAKFGLAYAYKRLRMQGFNDRYIRTHFLPVDFVDTI